MPVVFFALVLIVLLVFFVLFLLSIPLSLFLRYRAGKARRLARPWVTTTNLVSLAVSTAVFLAGASLSTFWVPRALPYAALGLLGGGALGLLGLAMTRWEPTPRGLWYTPNRWLVLFVSLVVVARVSYGLWRVWHVWHRDTGQGWLDAFGVAQSLAAGGIVLGYYLVYLAGLRRNVRPTKTPRDGE